MNQAKILVFAGSTRGDSLHRKLARTAAEALRGAGAEVTLADLKDFPMPLYDGDLEAAEGQPGGTRKFRDLIEAHDALAIASPEYNGSFPAIVKNVVDWVSRPISGERPAQVFRGRSAALLSTSPGPGGGRRGLKHLRELLTMIGMTVIPEEMAIPGGFEALDSEGRLTRAQDRETLAHVAAQLVAAAGRRAQAA